MPGHHRLLEPALAALAALALAIGFTWPAALHPTRVLLGHPGNDSWNHAWGYWWVARALRAGDWPDHIDLLGFPDGGTLYFIDTAQAILSLPVQALLGPAAAFNLVMLGDLALAGFGAWLLARRLTGDALAAGLSLVLFGSAPHLLGQAYNGITETVCTGWIPLTLWALLKLVDRPTWPRSLVLGLLAGLCTVTSWYHGLFAALAGGLLLGWIAARQPYQVAWLQTSTRLLGAAAVAAAMVVPLFVAFTRSLAAPDAIVSRDPAFVWDSLIQHNITDAAALFTLSRLPSPDLLALHGEQLVIVTHLGWVGLALAAAAIAWTRRYQEAGPWIAVGILFFLLALGPYLNVGGEYVQVAGRRVPLPFLLVFDALPVFDRISHPFRFVTGVGLSLAVFAAVALRHALRRTPPALQAATVALLAGLAVAETAWASPARIPVPVSDATIPRAYAAIAQDSGPGAVLDLPLTVPNLERAVYVWYQTAHGRPVPWGLNDPMPARLLQNHLVTTLIRIEATRARTPPPRLPELDLVVSARTLARQGYRFVVVHERLYPPFKARQALALLRGLFGEPEVYEDDGIAVFTVQPPGASVALGTPP